MQLIPIIVYLSHIIWSFPPFRQYKGKFFNYFLIIAMGDPIGTFLIRVGYKNNHPVYALIAAASLLFVLSLIKNISLIPALSFILFTLAAGILMPFAEVNLMTAAILMVLIYYFIRYMIIFIGKHGRVSLFHFLFLLYNASLVFKLVNFTLEIQKGGLYFYSTTIFDIILGILFCIFREENKRFSLHLSKPFNFGS